MGAIKYLIDLSEERQKALNDLEKINSLLAAYKDGVDISNYLLESETTYGQLACKQIIDLFKDTNA